MESSIWFNDNYSQQQNGETFFGVFNTDPYTIGSKLPRPLNPDSFVQQPRDFFPSSTTKMTESESSTSAFLEQYCSEPTISFGSRFQSSHVSTFPQLSLFDIE